MRETLVCGRLNFNIAGKINKLDREMVFFLWLALSTFAGQ